VIGFNIVLPPFQNVGRFDFFRFIDSKYYESKKVKMTYILKRSE